MGLTPFACITIPDSVRVVYPDGRIDSLSRSLSVYELLLGNPDYYVCAGNRYPQSLANRMGADEMLQKGMTYFVCAATPDAEPFIEFTPTKKTHRILLRLSRRSMREIRSPASKVFDVHSATMQQMESIREQGGRPPKHLQLKLVFVRHCLQALRLHRTTQFTDHSSPAISNESVVPAPAVPDVDVLPIFKSAARSELGLYVSRRQEFYLRRARRRRKVVWKPVLQSISEMAPVVEFISPFAPQDEADVGGPPPPRKNISPPRQSVVSSKNISPPRVVKHAAPQERPRGSKRSLYLA